MIGVEAVQLLMPPQFRKDYLFRPIPAQGRNREKHGFSRTRKVDVNPTVWTNRSIITGVDMAARGKNAKKKDRRRRHAGTRRLEREAAAAGVNPQYRQEPRRPGAQPGNR